MKNKKGRLKNMFIFIFLVVVIFIIVTIVRYKNDMDEAYKRINNYPIETIETEYGRVSFLDSGEGEAVLLSHGIFGGYDQAYETLDDLLGEDYRKIAPSRFGYPGSDIPNEPNPNNQAEAFIDILDELKIDETFIISTSAGGSPGIKLAINYPERVKGLILLSSGMPTTKKSLEDIEGPLGPPDLVINDFPMWFVLKHFNFAMDSMFGSDVTDDVYKTMMPIKPRKSGIKNDEKITNIDMIINYDEYPVDNLDIPILVIHAKDDPMAKYSEAKKFISRVNPETAIFETGGHLITGHQNEINNRIRNFIEENK